MPDRNLDPQSEENVAAAELARDLSAGQEGSPGIRATGQSAADAVNPSVDKLDEGDLSDYDQAALAEGYEGR